MCVYFNKIILNLTSDPRINCIIFGIIFNNIFFFEFYRNMPLCVFQIILKLSKFKFNIFFYFYTWVKYMFWTLFLVAVLCAKCKTVCIFEFNYKRRQNEIWICTFTCILFVLLLIEILKANKVNSIIYNCTIIFILKWYVTI